MVARLLIGSSKQLQEQLKAAQGGEQEVKRLLAAGRDGARILTEGGKVFRVVTHWIFFFCAKMIVA